MRGFIAAIKLLTIFPIDTRNRLASGSIGSTLFCFPLVGLLLGGVSACVFWLAAMLFPPGIAGALALAALVICTGGLHIDGLADTADGLFGGRTRERKLEIMRDSRIGTFGVVAIVLLLGLKFIALDGAMEISQNGAVFLLLLMPMAGRWAVLLAAGLCTYAREGEGTGRQVVDSAKIAHFAACAPVVGVAAWLGLGPAGLLMLGILLIAVPLLILGIRAMIGGMTGDTLGAVCELAELVFLLSFFVAAKAQFLEGVS